jgi:hypothetical protein
VIWMAEPEDDEWWKPQAKCRDMLPTFFFPVLRDQFGLPIILKSGAEKPDLDGVKRAKRFCWGTDDDEVCPVRTECLHWAIMHEQWEGVYGGMVERERRKYAKRKRAGIAFGGGVKAPQRPRAIGKQTSR